MKSSLTVARREPRYEASWDDILDASSTSLFPNDSLRPEAHFANAFTLRTNAKLPVAFFGLRFDINSVRAAFRRFFTNDFDCFGQCLVLANFWGNNSDNDMCSLRWRF